MQIVGFDESATLPASLANGAGAATNRNATEAITLTVPTSDPGTSYEIHCVNEHELVVELPTSEVTLSAGTYSRVNLQAGAALVLRLVAPGIWGALYSGAVSFS